MMKFFGFAVATAVVAFAQGADITCGKGTIFVEETRSCEIIQERVKRVNDGPGITTKDGNIMINVEDGKKVGFSVGGKLQNFNDFLSGINESQKVYFDNVSKTIDATSTTLETAVNDINVDVGNLAGALDDFKSCGEKGLAFIDGSCSSTAWVVTSGDTACSADNTGALKYSTSEGGLLLCKGSAGWSPVSPPDLGTSKVSPGASCEALKAGGFSRGSGLYWIKDADGTLLVGCDMGASPAKTVGNGASPATSAPSCLQMFSYHKNVNSSFSKFWINKKKSYCHITNEQIAGGEANKVPYGDGKSAATAGLSCQFVYDTVGLTDGSKVYLADANGNNVRLQLCLVDKGVASSGFIDGQDAKRAAPSCKAILQNMPAVKNTGTKIYYLTAGANGQPMQCLCDMTTNGGGWTHVARVSNQDGKNFYNKGEKTANKNPLKTGAVIKQAEMLKRGPNTDALGIEYSTIKGTDLMVFDERLKTFVSGTFSSTQTMKARFTSIKYGSPVSAEVRCAVNAENIITSKNTMVGGIAVKGFGLKCEDDKQPNWICDDDAVWIGWGKFSPWHGGGIAKCGKDGGDDIYNRGNAEAVADVGLWVR